MSQRDITYQHQKRYNSGTDKLSKVKHGEKSQSGAQHATHVQGH